VQSRGKNVSLKKYFARQSGEETELQIRGQEGQKVTMLAARLNNKQPGLPVGCMTDRLKMDALISSVTDIVQAENPIAALDSLTKVLRDAVPERSSRKHMAGLDLGRQEATNSLRYRTAA
jgi:hypothetical protein